MNNVIKFPAHIETRAERRAFKALIEIKRTCQRSPLETLVGDWRDEPVYNERDLQVTADQAATVRGQQSAIDLENLFKMAHDYIALCPKDSAEMVVWKMREYWIGVLRGEWVK